MSADEEKTATNGELKLSDLPPIENLTVSVPAENLLKLGQVLSIVDVLLVVESLELMPPLDLDTVLFKQDGTPVGQIFDVFGPVKQPHYSIRFNSAQEIQEKALGKGVAIYFAPREDRQLTKFAFIDKIRQLKGSDASWEHDNEPPEAVVEYSDDEEEAAAKRRAKAKRKQMSSDETGLSQPPPAGGGSSSNEKSGTSVR